MVVTHVFIIFHVWPPLGSWDLGLFAKLLLSAENQSPRHSVTTPGIDNVVHGIAGRHTFGLRNLTNALRAEGAFRVDVDHLSRQTPPVLPGYMVPCGKHC